MNNFRLIFLYGFTHFYIDFICALVLALAAFQNPFNLERIASLVLLYNVIAFGSQPLFGIYVDKKKNPAQVAAVGIIFTFIGMALFFNPFIAAILLGIGNAMFHVAGGVVALNIEPSKAKYPGIYVSTGALGLFAGGILGYLQVKPLIFVLVGVFVSFVLAFFTWKLPVPKRGKFRVKKKRWITGALMLLLVSVCARSIIGYALNLTWKSAFVLGLIFVIAVFTGKFLGGFLADKYGFMRVGIAGLIIAAPLLIFFQHIPVAIYLGIFCFNLVMPITLTAVAEMLPNNKGFAFGLTTLSLIFGTLLFYLLRNFVAVGMFFATMVLLINIASLYFGLRKYDEINL